MQFQQSNHYGHHVGVVGTMTGCYCWC